VLPVSGPVRGVPGRLAFVAFSSEGRSALRAFEIATGAVKDIVVHPPGFYATTPAASPDGRRIAYGLYRPAPQGSATPGGVDLEVIDADGTGRRTMLAHDAPGVAFAEPTWVRDGRAVYFVRTLPDGARRIDRVDVAQRTSQPIVADAHGPALSRDRMAFLRTNPQTFSQALWIARVDGRYARPIVGDATFFQLGTPRFSPDGSRIAFAASGGPPRPTPTRSEIPRPGGRSWWAVRVAWAHGPPMDVWLINADGSGLRALTALGEDDTVPAWSADGRWIAFTGAAGLYLVEVSSGMVRLMVEGGAGGGLTWLPR
jgi:Tol biopolymer transport system component